MGKGKKYIPTYLYDDDPESNFSMITSNLLRSKAYQSLSHAARDFYIVLCTHKQTVEQTETLFASLKEYYKLRGVEKTDYDLRLEAGQDKRSVKKSSKFVIPSKQLREYGYSDSYASKLKKELINHGFIKVFANEKRKSNNKCFDKNVTIYEFISNWKKQ